MPERPCGLGEINLFQILLASYQIIVVSVDHGYEIIFKGPTQPIVEQPHRESRTDRGSAAGLATVRANLSDEAEEEGTEPLPPPLHVYFDIEARQETREHAANLLSAEREDSNEQFTFEGTTCIEAFLDWALTLTGTNNPHVKRVVICIANKLKGYDS